HIHIYHYLVKKYDQLKLQSPAHSYFEKDDQAIPIAKKEVEDTIYDFRKNKKIASVALDHTFSDIDRDKDGLARITLSNDTDSKTTLWMDESYQYLQLYSGDTLPDAKRRRHSIAIEPMSAPPDAFNSGVDLIKLEPEETKSFTWGIEPNLIKS
ncbi:aldose-1-epimerase, partial [mine drainage metagenome]